MIPKMITREYIKTHKDIIFVFGDNLQQKGFGGQAASARGELNAYGVPTKKYPNMDSASFFTDDEFDDNKKAIDSAIKEIPDDGRTIVVFPNIGKGLAMLNQKAPRTYEYLIKQLAVLKERQ